MHDFASKRLIKNLLLFTLLRVGLIIASALVIAIICNLFKIKMPLYVYILFGILYALPFSLLFDDKIRFEIGADLNHLRVQRRLKREKLMEKFTQETTNEVD